MPKPHKPASPDRPLVIGGQTFTIRFSLRAIMALQDRWGLATEEEVQARLGNPKDKVRDFVDILWASLRTHHPEITPEQVLDMVDEAGLDGLAETARAAMTAAAPPTEAARGPQRAAAQSAQR